MARRPKPWYRKARGAWFVTIDGVQHNLGPDKKEAYDRFYELMRQPQRRKVSSESLVAIIDAFLEWTKHHRSPDTFEWYRYRLQRFVDRCPDLRSSDLRPFHVQQWVDSYVGLSTTSRRNYLRTVKRCMKWAEQQGYIEANPLSHLEIPAAEHRDITITEPEFDQFLSFARDESLSDLLVVTWKTGCRPQESLRVEARHVDSRNERWVFPRSESKTRRNPRVVYLADEALEITKRLLIRYPAGPLFRNSKGKPWTKSAVNCAFVRIQIRMGRAEMNRRNESVSHEAIQEFIPKLCTTRRSKGKTVKKTAAELRFEAKLKLTRKRACQLAPKYSLYALRHAWATNALQRGVDALTVAILMGHQDPSTLAKVYQHLSHNPQHLLEQAKKAAG